MHSFLSTQIATTSTHTLPLHDALPILTTPPGIPVGATIAIQDRFDTTNQFHGVDLGLQGEYRTGPWMAMVAPRSEEHTSELQSLRHLVYRLLHETKIHTMVTPHYASSR